MNDAFTSAFVRYIRYQIKRLTHFRTIAYALSCTRAGWHPRAPAGTRSAGWRPHSRAVIAYIKTKPFGDSSRVALTCNRRNLVALRLYEKKGFVATGTEYDDELELAMTVG